MPRTHTYRKDTMLEDTREEAALAVAAECVHECLPLLDSVESVAGERSPTLEDQLPKLVEYFQGGAAVRAAEWVCHALAVAWSKEEVVAEWRQALRRAAQGGARPGEWNGSALFHLLRAYHYCVKGPTDELKRPSAYEARLDSSGGM